MSSDQLSIAADSEVMWDISRSSTEKLMIGVSYPGKPVSWAAADI